MEVVKLNKSFRGKKVVTDLSFTVEEGDIFGFLGPNGAGKTTTIRMMLGLIHPDSGTVRINGHDIKNDFNHAISGVGAIVETPKFYPFMSAYQNLLLIANLHPELPRKRIDEVLEIVSLSKNTHEKVKNFSLGMKQRLGLARALLNYPKVVFLDEPMNGLDPQGMQENRGMICQLASEQDITFFITSHLLHEIEQTCNKVAILKEGKLVAQNSIKDMLNRETEMVEIRTKSAQAAANLLKTTDLVKSLELRTQGLWLQLNKGESGKVNQFLLSNQISVDYLIPINQSLEQLFLELTEGGK